MSPAPIGNTNAAGHGAPANNANRLRHGVRAYLTRGRLPKGCDHDRKALKAFEDALYAELSANGHEIRLYVGAVVQTALRHEGRARLLTRWLAKEQALSVSERVQIATAIGNASDSRDRCLKLLGLDQHADPLDAYKRALMAPAVSQAVSAESEAQAWTEHPSGTHETSTAP